MISVSLYTTWYSCTQLLYKWYSYQHRLLVVQLVKFSITLNYTENKWISSALFPCLPRNYYKWGVVICCDTALAENITLLAPLYHLATLVLSWIECNTHQRMQWLVVWIMILHIAHVAAVTCAYVLGLFRQLQREGSPDCFKAVFNCRPN